ncbi:DUF3243 domain-containing protein [Peribacillus cavernae]|jgi:chorismate mutase|uniref:DUF3243 domain-containing protein n=1 Tax=Peribacillus cavernae TaxID=1674310 RepID=A0A3S0TQM9_9BACI|nr:DUF3243 domain-containing protein [Peribacillus cavernae]MDQ0219944.1 chorismate mutase [Peribacillus cavernae]RUQ24255.1 DUF3243 domain-containing protein [Peribacillus cavernae]
MAEKEHIVLKNGTVHTENVDEALRKIEPEKVDEILSNFENFKSYLDKRLDIMKKVGLEEEQLANTAEKVADYLADKIEPKNREEKLLQELWKVGNDEERHKLAHMLVKLVDKQ